MKKNYLKVEFEMCNCGQVKEVVYFYYLPDLKEKVGELCESCGKKMKIDKNKLGKNLNKLIQPLPFGMK